MHNETNKPDVDVIDCERVEEIAEQGRGETSVNTIIEEHSSLSSPKKKKKKKNLGQVKDKPADASSLDQLVTKGLSGTGLLPQTSFLKYCLIDDWSQIRRALARDPNDPNSVQILTHAHTCIHASTGFSRSIMRAVPNLEEADKATPKSKSKLGTFTMTSFETRNPKVKAYVNNLYVQFCTNVPYRGAPENNHHVNLSAVRMGMRSIFKMYPDQANHAIVIFGSDPSYPTAWSAIENELEELCKQLNVKLTVFVPRFYVVQPHQVLDGRLAEYLRSVGFIV